VFAAEKHGVGNRHVRNLEQHEDHSAAPDPGRLINPDQEHKVIPAPLRRGSPELFRGPRREHTGLCGLDAELLDRKGAGLIPLITKRHNFFVAEITNDAPELGVLWLVIRRRHTPVPRRLSKGNHGIPIGLKARHV